MHIIATNPIVAVDCHKWSPNGPETPGTTAQPPTHQPTTHPP
jgi:hypothetical protein